MVIENYIYAPALETVQKFRCSVPMKGSRQVFVVNGGVQGTKVPFSFNLKPDEILPEILQIIGIRTKESPLEMEFGSNFVFESNSSAKILLCSHTFSSDDFSTNETIDISLKEGADADFVVIQNEYKTSRHSTKFNISLESGSKLKINFITLHGGIITNEIKADLKGEGAYCEINGLYLVDGEQTISTNIYMNHLVPNCKSSQLFKGILDDKAVSNFYGLISVVPDAQQTEAYQANHNLLLSKGARVFSKPQLEIYADNVKCSHGATSGRLDDDELFYMRSRGIPAKEAKLIQQLAFALSVLEKISTEELKGRMSNLVEKRLRGEFSNCDNCSKNCC